MKSRPNAVRAEKAPFVQNGLTGIDTFAIMQDGSKYGFVCPFPKTELKKHYIFETFSQAKTRKNDAFLDECSFMIRYQPGQNPIAAAILEGAASQLPRQKAVSAEQRLSGSESSRGKTCGKREKPDRGRIRARAYRTIRAKPTTSVPSLIMNFKPALFRRYNEE